MEEAKTFQYVANKLNVGDKAEEITKLCGIMLFVDAIHNIKQENVPSVIAFLLGTLTGHNFEKPLDLVEYLYKSLSSEEANKLLNIVLMAADEDFVKNVAKIIDETVKEKNDT